LQNEVKSAINMLYKWLLTAKFCAVAPSETTITWKKSILPGITIKNLLSMARGFTVHLYSRVMSYVASGSEKWAFSELPLFVRPLTISPKAITKGIKSGRRFMKRPGVEVWHMPQLETSTTAGVNSPLRLLTRANENA